MRAVIGLSGALLLAACGGGTTTGTNYSEAPPVAEIVGTPSPRPSETPASERSTPEAETSVTNADMAVDNSN